MIFEISLLSLILGASTVITGVSLIIRKEREGLENKHRAVAYENERLKNLIEERERFFKEREGFFKEKEEAMEILNNERMIHLTEMKELISKSNPSEDHKKDLKKITDRFLDIAEKGAEEKSRIVHNHNNLTSKGPFANDLY